MKAERVLNTSSAPYDTDLASDTSEDDDDSVVYGWKYDPSSTEIFDRNGVLLGNFPVRSYSPPPSDQEQNVPEEERRKREALPKDSGKLPPDEFRERQIAYSLSTARRNLTRLSQFILKLECRAGQITKEGIRATLDATVDDNADVFSRDDPDHLAEIEDIRALSDGVFKRLYLIDKHWQQQHHDNGSLEIQLKSEPAVKAFLKEELRMNHLAGEDTCFYTVQDLLDGRRIEDYIDYLVEYCDLKDHPTDIFKLVQIAWRFLDRDLRGPRPTNPTTVEDFMDQFKFMMCSGAFQKALKTPTKNREEDEEAWKAIQKYWSSRVQH
ncbi:hypothetical protein GGR54DRAFT_201443 [Hypoxylon sp. NC1633]|nr:hypothetical protein GGR54DRAFT_201443 [Hypoxylon sp. NC1633]